MVHLGPILWIVNRMDHHLNANLLTNLRAYFAMCTRVLKPQHLCGIWSGLTPYRLPLDTLSEYPEP